MKEIGKERKIAISALIVAVLMLTVAFAAMSRTLKINGTAKVDSANWDIRFTSAEMKSKKGDARQVVEPVIDNGGINLTLKVGLRKPKDEITYEAVIENLGDIDAEIESIEYPELTEDQSKIIEFEATYQNGDEISKSQEINSGEEKTVKIVIRYKDITDESLLAKEAYDVPLTFKINYIQKGFNTESVPGGDIVVDDGSKVILSSSGEDIIDELDDPSTASFANSPIERGKIEVLEFVKGSNSARTGNTWDASAAGDGSITGYYTDSDSNGLYEVVIESPSNIYAPVDSTTLFACFTSLKEIKFNNFRTDDVTQMEYMFYDCSSLTNLDLTSFDTSNVTNMNTMFYNCSSLASLNINHFNTSNVTDMGGLFENCSSLTNLDLSNFNTSNVEYSIGIFEGCTALETLDISSFEIGKSTNWSYLFAECSSLREIKMNSLDLSTCYTSNAFDNVSNVTIYVKNQGVVDILNGHTKWGDLSNSTFIIQPLES